MNVDDYVIRPADMMLLFVYGFTFLIGGINIKMGLAYLLFLVLLIPK